ncbi:SusD/RagB family nutrient-binding outer membrane lipoprotein [Hymenobacter sp. BT186]|uniref:SusD/RagB family nutrient-binding outer membrane lipoprotein n=1 Tax=Hymenobacter telluris TaxID=2816474 RepID=A0A939JD02_9BACT|nr:SusD/RagB family nutrient-binding outer membrane lipoprotein [Hymenobacter telluris]MBO0358885.1 SusD/RagB family nutrient-binding outer membrane lipoprotein [Hymenobacter telluris]MBW3374911.1 SusD/RagB family nutrient-binding outer membrane lipoprotein [Hymenobacter norwichensis]
MKKYLLLLGLLVGGGALSSCETFLDVNTDPNNPTSSTPNFLLPGGISQAAQQQMFTSLVTPYITQHIVRRAPASSTDQYYFTTGNGNNTFNYFYFYVSGNLRATITAAEAEGSPYYVGAAKITQAMSLAHLTDMMGDVPFTEAFQGGGNYSPKYDSQEQIYQTVFRLLDEGEAELSKPATANVRPLYVTVPSPSGDIMYRGDVSKWIKLAYSLRARQLNHLTKKSTYNPQAVLAAVDKGFTSSADDAQIQLETPVPPITGSTSIFGTARANFAGATYSQNLLRYLNGSTANAAYPGVQDPRLPVMATSVSVGTNPGVSGGTPIAQTGNASDFYSSWYARDLGYYELITYHELKFIEAEAAFRAGNPARALQAYRQGIEAHIRKLSGGGTFASQGLTVTFPVLTQQQIDGYLNSAAVAQNVAQLDYKRIMEQKYIALFLNPEAWSDMRRFDFRSDIYVNLAYPNGANPIFNPVPADPTQRKFPRRLLPALTETQYNPQNVAAIGGLDTDYATRPLWWDQP